MKNAYTDPHLSMKTIKSAVKEIRKLIKNDVTFKHPLLSS